MKKFGFTLAEVLITLGVIGVVAAITLPILTKNYQKHVWVNQLKANYSIINQGFAKIMADDGVDNLANTEIWQHVINSGSIDGCRYLDTEATSETCKEFYESLKKYFSITSIEIKNKTYKINGISNTTENINGPLFNLSNGAQIFRTYFRQDGYVYLTIDINGDKKPNTNGRDVFHFANIYKNHSGYGAMFRGIGSCNTTSPYDCWKTSPTYIGCGCGNDYTGRWNGCAGRIIENGWKMDY